MEEEDDSIHDSKPEDPSWRKEKDEDWSVIETQRISDEMGSTGKCYVCDFSCEPGDSLWYNPPRPQRWSIFQGDGMVKFFF